MNKSRTNNGMNGNMNGNMTDMNRNRQNGNGGVVQGSLLEQIRALGFVKVELELYLDTHPKCPTALDYYYQTIEALKRLTEEYENTVGPLTAMGSMGTNEWTWVKEPWPWQRADDVNNQLWRGGNR